jgi:hypothetical protein
VNDAVCGQHFRNRVGAAFVPDFFEPAANQGFVFFYVVLLT